MYSMGITFYEIAALHHPFDVEEKGDVFEAWRNAHFTKIPEDPRKYNQNLDSKLSQLILKMMSKRAGDRYKSWDEVLERLSNSEEGIDQPKKVSALVELALKKHIETENKRLEIEDKKRKELEQKELIIYSFNEIVEIAKGIIDVFNDESEFLKLAIQQYSEMEVSIFAQQDGGDLPTVSVRIEQAKNMKIQDKKIIAWGWAKSPSGRGFNLLLTIEDNDDIYGKWETFHNRHNPLSPNRNKRLEPFPFEFSELPREIKYLNPLHNYRTKKGIFKAEYLHTLIKELI
jgi:hypothetical protein